MSHDLTPAPAYGGAVTVPDSGDPRTVDSVNPAFQKLADWSAFACSVVSSRLAWSEEIAVAPGGSNSTFSITVGAIQAASLLRADGTYHGYSATAATLTAANLESGSTLANSTWYYIYAHDSLGGGTVLYQISTTAPRASQQYKNAGDGSQYRYLGCFRTNSSGAPLAMRMRRGRYTYRLSSSTGDFNAYDDATARGSAYDVSLASLVPPHVRIARVQAITTSSGADTFMSLLAKPDSAGIVWRQQAPDGTTTYGELDIETDSSQVVQLTYNVGGGSGNAKIRVAGFVE